MKSSTLSGSRRGANFPLGTGGEALSEPLRVWDPGGPLGGLEALEGVPSRRTPSMAGHWICRPAGVMRGVCERWISRANALCGGVGSASVGGGDSGGGISEPVGMLGRRYPCPSVFGRRISCAILARLGRRRSFMLGRLDLRPVGGLGFLDGANWTFAGVPPRDASPNDVGMASPNPLELRGSIGEEILSSFSPTARRFVGGAVASAGEDSVTGGSFWFCPGVWLRLLLGGKGSFCQNGSTGVSADMAMGVAHAERPPVG